MFRVLLTLLIWCVFSIAHAQTFSQPLPVEKAFAVTGYMDENKQLVLQWNIAPGYYLYRKELTVSPAANNQVKIGTITLPEGVTKKDGFHGVFQSYSGLLVVHIPLAGKTSGLLDLNFNYQGCSTGGFCYPPVKQKIQVQLAQITGPTDLTDNIVSAKSDASHILSEQDYATQLFSSQHVVFVLLGFLGLGLLLAFTPCVLPMVPILSSIIIGHGNKVSTQKAFFLSLAYVLGMAITYAIAGMIVALAGSNVQAAMQKPWVIGMFSGVFILLALSLFGLYDVKLPNKLQQRMASLGQGNAGGTYASVFVMGMLSTLVVSPCVSAPLVGVLTYIANNGNVLLGGAALLALGLGMGIPLLLIGTTASKLLPKSGAWMDQVKHLFGFFMLGLAIWMVGRILPMSVTLYLWALLAMGMAIYVWRLKRSKKIWRQLHNLVGVALLSYGLILISSAVLGYTNPLNLFGNFAPSLAVEEESPFVVVKNMDDLDQQLQRAKKDGKKVVLDFYADWCASCLVMDHHVFNQVAIKDGLNQFVLLRADVTKNNSFDRALLQRYHVVAPPTVEFFDTEGNRLAKDEIVGEVSAKEFLADIVRVSDHQTTRLCQSNTQNC
jgi:thiol:disulfide interchange protein DsbD